MGFFTGNIARSTCAKYNVTNGTGASDTLTIKKLVNSSGTTTVYETVSETVVLSLSTIVVTVPDSTIYVLYWGADVNDKAVLINKCRIEACMLQLIVKLLECKDCEETVASVKLMTRYNSVNMLYNILRDLLAVSYGIGVTVWYDYSAFATNELYSINDILRRLDQLCTCTKC